MLRWDLVHYSTAVKPNERVLITMMEIDTFPLARAVYAQVVRLGDYHMLNSSLLI